MDERWREEGCGRFEDFYLGVWGGEVASECVGWEIRLFCLMNLCIQ